MKKILGLLILLVIVGVGWWFWRNRGEGRIQITYETAEQRQRRKDTQMEKQLQEMVGEQKYAVGVYRLATGESYGFNLEEIMPARSVIKVPIMITAVNLYENKYEDLLMKMGKNSDNKAQVKIEKIVGVGEIKKTLERLDMRNTNFENNTTTVNDLIKMWRYVSQNEIWEKYFVDSIWEDRITKGIPVGTKLVHKVGTDLNIWNDSGIVYATKPFILVILNEGVERTAATKLVPELTQTVWNYEVGL